MPPGEEHAAFTVLRGHAAAAAAATAPARRAVNVVQPVQRQPHNNTMLDPKFSRALDLRLRRLHHRHATDDTEPDRDPQPAAAHGRRTRRNAPSLEMEKPRFVTTVKTGQFLLPPPEVATLLGLETLYPHPPPQPANRLVYSYSSRPQAVEARAKRPPQPASNGAPCGAAGRAFGGVRALIAGVAGMTHLLNKQQDGSLATTQYSNVMHDKRVVRGSTFVSHPHAAGDGGESAAARAARTRRRALARRKAAARLRPGTPPPAPGRRHHPIQTEYYLEELFDKGVEMEVGVQTDLFVDRPATPVYVPAKTGADASTQIYPGELFDFDLEVQPVLEVLVGKTTEQALAEVAQEEELATLREQQRRFQEARDAERAERARLQAQDARLAAERSRRVAQARAAASAATEARERAAAAALAHGYLADLLPAVLAGLREHGYLVERVRRGLDEEFLPWLTDEVAKEMEAILTSRDVIAEIVRDVCEARADLYRRAGDVHDARASPPDSVTPPSELEGEGEEDPME